jgi:hypothetical protein
MYALIRESVAALGPNLEMEMAADRSRLSSLQLDSDKICARLGRRDSSRLARSSNNPGTKSSRRHYLRIERMNSEHDEGFISSRGKLPCVLELILP